MIKIAVAEDSLQFRKAFLKFMGAFPEFELLFEAENGVDLISHLKVSLPDILLLDIRMPVMDGFEAAQFIHREFPSVKVIAFTQFDLEENIVRMSRIGVQSFVGKHQIEQVPDIIRIVHRGGVYLPVEIAEILKSFLNRTSSPNRKCPVNLSEREKMLVQYLLKGLNRTEIGELMNKSPRTVEKYRSDLYQKFKVTNLQQLVNEASKWSFADGVE